MGELLHGSRQVFHGLGPKCCSTPHHVDRAHESCVMLPYAWWCGAHPATRLLPLPSAMRLLRVPMLVCHCTIHQHDTMLLIKTMTMTVICHAAASTLPVMLLLLHYQSFLLGRMAVHLVVWVMLHVVAPRAPLGEIVLARERADGVLDVPHVLMVHVWPHMRQACVSMQRVERRGDEHVPY